MPYSEATYVGPWTGADISMPETDIKPSATPFSSNIIARQGELRSRMRLANFCQAPQDGTPVLGLTSFIDINGVVHTVAITKLNLYQLSYNYAALNANGQNPWLVVASLPATNTSNIPYSIQNLQAKLFFTNGTPHVWQWDGISNTITDVGVLATGSCGSTYMMELNARIVLVSTIETSGSAVANFPFRARWSPTGFPSPPTFDPNTNLDAGFNDLLDCPDTLTGCLPIGRTGYLFRSNGITEMIPTTGQGNAWDFNHLWASDRGIGNAFPQTIAGFGPMGIFISGEGIYKITPTSFDDIGLGATDLILTDISNATGLESATILPYFSPKYPYSVYWLNLGVGNDTVSWFYNIKEQGWMRQIFRNKQFTCRPKYVFTH